MRTKPIVIGLTIIVCCLIGTLFILYSGANAQSTNPAIQSAPVSRHPSVGMPAITPRITVGSPRFTVGDVKAYLSKQPFPSGPTVSGKPLTIRSIEFITSKEASVRMHGESVGLPDTAQVCYVELYGPFTMQYVPVPPGAKPLPVSNIGVEVFDAQTGNLLLWWVP